MAPRPNYTRSAPEGKVYPAGERDYADYVQSGEWIYYDQSGNPHAKVVRKDDLLSGEKTYPTYHWQEIVIGSGHCEWVAGWPETLVPYRLPELLKAPPNETIYICEGEKNTERLAGMGFVATCNMGGAGKWHEDYNRWFAQRERVVILEDNDHAGRRHAERVARELFDIVKDVSILTFRELDEGEDVDDWLQKYGATPSDFVEKVKEAQRVRALPTIPISIAGEIRAIERCVELMNESLPLYMRHRLIVEPVSVIGKEIRNGKVVKVRRNFMRPVELPALSYFLRKHVANFTRFNTKGEELPTRPDHAFLQVVGTLAELQLPQIAGVINTPTLRPDGTLLRRTGYDEQTGLYFVPDVKLRLPPMPVNPTQADALAALGRLRTLFGECAFALECDASLTVAAAMTVVLRPACDTAPAFFANAPAPGTGKTYLQDTLTALGCGLPASTIAFSEDSSELQKRLDSAVISGEQFIVLDNFNGEIKNALLSQILTNQRIKIRLFHTQQEMECTWRGCLLGTGNNITIVGELTRRIFLINLLREEEHPELHQYKTDMLHEVMENRGRYVADILTIAIAYDRAVRAGTAKVRQGNYQVLAGYSDWCRWVRDPLLWLGECDPVKTMEEVVWASDPDREDAELFIELWVQILGCDNEYTAATIIDVATSTEQTGSGTPWAAGMTKFQFPELFEILSRRCADKGKPDVGKLGRWLRSINNRMYSGYMIVSRKDTKTKIKIWRLRQLGNKSRE